MIVIMFPILRVTIFCIKLESLALVQVLAFCTGEHLNYKGRPDVAFPVDGSAESLFAEINRTKKRIKLSALFVGSFADFFTLIEFTPFEFWG